MVKKSGQYTLIAYDVDTGEKTKEHKFKAAHYFIGIYRNLILFSNTKGYVCYQIK